MNPQPASPSGREDHRSCEGGAVPGGGGSVGAGPSVGGQSVGGSVGAGPSVGGQSVGGQSVGGQSVGGQSVGGQSVGGQSVGGQSVGGPGGAGPGGGVQTGGGPGGAGPGGGVQTGGGPAEVPGPDVVRAGGGIVVRASTTGGWEVVLIHRPLQGDWSLPKGKLEPGETLEECALREVREESGLTCVLGRFVGEVEYVDRKGRPKVVGYWLMQPIEGEWHRSDEVDALAWVPLAEAVSRLSYEHDRELLTAVSGAIGVAGHS
jgi:8-oxo-dGTP diphosphatase